MDNSGKIDPGDNDTTNGPALPDFVGPHLKRSELIRVECGRQRHIGGVAAARHQHPSNAGDVVAGIESVPCSTQVNLKPGAEIHGGRRRRHPNIAEVPGAIPRRYVQGPAECDGQVHVIAADSGALAKNVEGRAIGPGPCI